MRGPARVIESGDVDPWRAVAADPGSSLAASRRVAGAGLVVGPSVQVRHVVAGQRGRPESEGPPSGGCPRRMGRAVVRTRARPGARPRRTVRRDTPRAGL